MRGILGGDREGPIVKLPRVTRVKSWERRGRQDCNTLEEVALNTRAL